MPNSRKRKRTGPLASRRPKPPRTAEQIAEQVTRKLAVVGNELHSLVYGHPDGVSPDAILSAVVNRLGVEDAIRAIDAALAPPPVKPSEVDLDEEIVEDAPEEPDELEDEI